MTEEYFYQMLEEKGIILTSLQKEQLSKYYQLLSSWNEKINLTTITEKEAVYEKHFYDSLTIAFDYKFDNQSLLDIGAGAGFPSVVLKIVYPNLKVTVLDSVAKKMNFVNQVIKELDLKDIQTVSQRAEEYIKDAKEKYDIVTARAVARLNILMELASPYLKVGGIFIALKGANGQEEYHEARNAATLLNLSLVDHKEVVLPQEKSKRHNYFFKKTAPTSLKYPRPYNKIKQRPL